MAIAALVFGVLGGLLGLAIGLVGHTIGAMADSAGQSGAWVLRAISIAIPIASLVGGGLARDRSSLAAALMFVSAAGMLWIFGINYFTIVPIVLSAIGGSLALAATNGSRPRAAFIAVISVLVAASSLAFFDYVLPHHSVLRIVGTEIKRVGVDQPGSKGKPQAATRDVYYIYAESIETKQPRVFRNEDTGWGFPWYFKFDSADLQATAQSIAGERGTAIFTYYGWRIPLFTVMPNVVKIVRSDPDAWAFPWFNLVFFTVLVGGLAWLAWWIRGLRRPRA